jgi:type IV secretion system protein VirB5
MKIRSVILVAAAPFALAAMNSPAAAQGIPVFDTSTYAQTLAQVTNTLKIIEQGKEQITTASNQLQSLQKLTDVNSVATSLLNSATRNILPNTSIDASTLLEGDLSRIGSLGSLASSIQSRYAITPSTSSSADAAYNLALKDATGPAATMAALGENTLSITQTRMQGLDELRAQLDSAKDPKDVMDLQARIGVEQAQLQNDLLKMQAIQMAQQGQAALSLASVRAAAARDADATFASAILRK